MIDKKGKEIHIGDKVRWKTTSWANRYHEGMVVCCLPAYTNLPENVTKSHKMSGRLNRSAIDRVIVEVERPKSCPLLFTPRPSSVEVIR